MIFAKHLGRCPPAEDGARSPFGLHGPSDQLRWKHPGEARKRTGGMACGQVDLERSKRKTLTTCYILLFFSVQENLQKKEVPLGGFIFFGYF